MAIVNVQSNGVAPSGLSYGDIVKTAGKNNYQIVAPGTPGASYSSASGYWSVPVSKIVDSAISASSGSSGSSGVLNGIVSSAQQIANLNTASSQASADKQMAWQQEQNTTAMQFSRDEAEKNRNWQEMMSNTAHQREVKDLMAAGLNPILSAMGGAGATTPSGASASGVTSSGAMAQLDTSALGMIGNVIGALVSGNFSKAIAEINRDSQITTAQINAKSASNVANINSETQKWIKKNFPDNPYNLAGVLFNQMKELFNQNQNTAQKEKYK